MISIYHNVMAIPSEKAWDINHFLLTEGGHQIDVRPHFEYTNLKPSRTRPQFQGNIPEPKHIVQKGIFGGYGLMYFGHFIIDALARMWYCKDKEDVYYFPIDRECLHWNGIHINGFADSIGFRVENFNFILEPTLFRELIIPSPAFDEHIKPQKIWFDFINTCNWNSSIVDYPDKIYISRGNPRWSDKLQATVFGESAFEEYLKDQGFFILDTKKTSIIDQRELIRNANTTITIEGSAVYWSMFLPQRNGNKMIILARRTRDLNPTITGKEFFRIASQFTQSAIIDCVIDTVGGLLDSSTSKSTFLDWENISYSLKAMGVVKYPYKENGASRDDALRFLELNDNPALRFQIEKIIKDHFSK